MAFSYNKAGEERTNEQIHAVKERLALEIHPIFGASYGVEIFYDTGVPSNLFADT